MATSATGRHSVLVILDGVLFGCAGLSALWLANLVLDEGLQFGWQLSLLIVFWALVAYLVLPRIHRILTRLYVPGYFIGRTRTSDGLLGDPVNLALHGDEAQVHAAMDRAGWTRADEVTLKSGLRIVRSTLSRSTYAEAPVSPLNLFDRQQDFAYQQEVEGNPAKRHHVRFWRCPEDWLLPGGHPAGWLAAGTYDRSVGLSLLTFQVTHRIDQHTDVERDHIVATVTDSNPTSRVEVIRNYSTGYHSRNGGGDAIQTDGDLPFLDLRSVEPDPVRHRVETPTDSRDKWPAPVVFGAGATLLRGLLYLLVAVPLALHSDTTGLGLTRLEESTESAAALTLVALGAVDVALGLAIAAGRNWARVLMMLSCVVTIVGAYIALEDGGPRLTLTAGLPPVALSILVLLALTSHRARDYAEIRGRLRRERRRSSTSEQPPVAEDPARRASRTPP